MSRSRWKNVSRVIPLLHYVFPSLHLTFPHPSPLLDRWWSLYLCAPRHSDIGLSPLEGHQTSPTVLERHMCREKYIPFLPQCLWGICPYRWWRRKTKTLTLPCTSSNSLPTLTILPRVRHTHFFLLRLRHTIFFFSFSVSDFLFSYFYLDWDIPIF